MFEVKAKYSKIDEQSGKEKKFNAVYLVDAVSYTDAEAKMYAELEKMVASEFKIPAIKESNYQDILFFDDGECWYKVKFSMLSIDEEAGKERKQTFTSLVEACDIDQAKERLDTAFQGTTFDYDVISVAESNIIDVFMY